MEHAEKSSQIFESVYVRTLSKSRWE